LELSDDSDIEVHPNVDKKSFIRAKQQQIHQERQQRKAQIETYKYQRIINDALIKRITDLIAALKGHASEAESRNPAEVAFRAVMESAASLDPKDDQPPPRPAVIHNADEQQPSYTKMMAAILDDVNKKLEAKKVEQDKRYGAMIVEIEDHLHQATSMQAEMLTKLAELEKEEGRKITSEGIHTGFDVSSVTKSQPSTSTSGAGAGGSSSVELLNPNFTPKDPTASSDAVDDDDEDIAASPAATQFSKIKPNSYRESLEYLSKHPEILTEKDTDGILVLAFDAQLEGKDDYARNCVHQALLIQYCRALGRDGVALFFKRITTPGHQAQGVFFKDVQDTYLRIKTRAREINLERAKEAAEGGPAGVEQIQLHAVEPGTVINITIPPAGSDDPDVKQGREIFEAFRPDMRKALETGKLDAVNKVLGKMSVEEAEDVVAKLSEVCLKSHRLWLSANCRVGRHSQCRGGYH
jgi:cell division cycle protein 37